MPFFSVITQVRKSLIAKKVWFFSLIGKKKKKKRKCRVRSYKVARKAIMALSGEEDVCAGPQER